MDILSANSGSVTFIKLDDKNITLSLGNDIIGEDFKSCIIGIYFTKSEGFVVNKCFNETTHLLAFGHNPNDSIVKITVATFISDHFCNGSSPSGTGNYKAENVRNILKSFNNSRVGATGKCSGLLSIGDLSITGVVTNIAVNMSDPKTKICIIEITMMILETDDAA